MRAGLLLSLFLALGCGAGDGLPGCGDGLALQQVSVVDGLGGPALAEHTVVVCDGRIVELAPTATARVPRGVKAVDLRGRTVIPGLIDTHAHVTILPVDEAGRSVSQMHQADSERTLETLLAFGITSVRNPAGPATEAVALRDAVETGSILGPRMKTAGEALNHQPNSSGPAAPFAGVADEAAVRAEVERQAALGVDYIKVYAALPPELVASAIEAAHEHGLEVIGHLQRTDWTQAARLGIDFITHGAPWSAAYLPEATQAGYRGTLRERMSWLEKVDLDGPEIAEMIEQLVAHKVSIDPTLLVYRTKFFGDDPRHTAHPEIDLAPQTSVEAWRRRTFTDDWSAEDFARGRQVWPLLLELTRRLHEGGVVLTAGSDLPNPWVIPGVSLHEELQLLADAGIPPLEVLRIATYNGAQALGWAGEVGSLEIGKRADLVVLAADPLRRIANTRAIEFVLLNGRVLSPAALLAED